MMETRALLVGSDNVVALQRQPLHPAEIAETPQQETPITLAPRNLRPLGQILLEDGAVEEGNLLKATVLRRRENVRLGEILLAHDWVTEAALTRALSRQWRTSVIDLRETPPDPRLIDAAGANYCLTHGIVPWRRIGGVTWVATCRPEEFTGLMPHLPAAFGTIRMVLCEPVQAQEAILAPRRNRLIRLAENCLPGAESCQTRDERRTTRLAVGLLALLAFGLVAFPTVLLLVLTIWAVGMMAATTVLKVASFIAAVRVAQDRKVADLAIAARKAVPAQFDALLPVISVMVPMFRESDIAGKLVERLSKLDYPRELTDVLLVIEESDHVTRAALKGAWLPRWMRIVVVPEGPVQTKPRALNYALNFCRGSIIGVWDAEDRPEPDQLHRVARGFHFAAPDVACLQGALDFYNPRTNWLARCFTIEYAAWFRVYLPGLARLGLVVPLGGTTLFFRRDALQAVGGWDAWNVTEDADLGVRLVRRGWRTEIIQTTTDEEANCRTVPWIKQRSRWIKGFAMTWAVHMRDPVQLWRDLGTKRFIALQIQLFASVSQALLAPVLWSFWLMTLGLPHSLAPMLGGMLWGYGVYAMAGTFLLAEVISIVVGVWAVRGAKHRHLSLFVPTMHFYNPLACLAAWKAIYEVVARPFYWDKTTHGVFDATQAAMVEDINIPAVAGMVSVPMLGQIGGRSLSDIAAERPVETAALTGAAAVAADGDHARFAG